MNKKILIILLSLGLLVLFSFIISFLAGYKSENIIPFASFPTPTPVSAPGFSRNTPGGTTDTTNASRLKIVGINPENGAKQVPLTQPIIITFAQPVATESVSFTLFPEVDYVISSRLNSLIITPTSTYYPNVIYSFTLATLSGDTLTSGSFSSGDSQTPTQPLSEDYPYTDKLADAEQRQKFPDVFLAGYIPYDGTSFSVNDDFSSSPSGHYIFHVFQDAKSAKNDFLTWLKKLGMTQDQINRLEVTYQ